MAVESYYFVIFLCVLFPSTIRGQCTERGRFPNHLGECRGYTMCINGAAGFMEYNLTCPEMFVYSHIENLCTNVTSYKCLPHYNCTGVGNFESDSKENCTAFVACVEGMGGFVTARWVQCPQETLFSLDEKSCVNATSFTCRETVQPNIPSVKVDSVHILGNRSSNRGTVLNSKQIIIMFSILLFLYESK